MPSDRVLTDKDGNPIHMQLHSDGKRTRMVFGTVKDEKQEEADRYKKIRAKKKRMKKERQEKKEARKKKCKSKK